MANAVVLLGVEVIDPTNPSWLKNDPLIYYSGTVRISTSR
jgi:hypothetical protein